MKKKVLGLILTALLAVTGFTSCSTTIVAKTGWEQYQVVRGDLTQTVTAHGTLNFVRDSKLSFGTTGKIDELPAVEGARVSKGAVLARLDLAPLTRTVKTAQLVLASVIIQRDQANIAVQSANISLQQATDSYRKISYPYTYSTVVIDMPQALGYMNSAQNQINNAVSGLQVGRSDINLDEVKSQLKQALDSITQGQQLLNRQGSGADIFGSQYLSMDKYWTLRAAQLQMDQSQQTYESAVKSAAAAQLAVDRAQNDLDNANYALDTATIKAPFDGVIANVAAKTGDILSAVNYTQTIIELIDPQSIELDLVVSDKDVSNIAVGQTATISANAMPSTSLTGKVTFVSPVSQATGSSSYEVILSVDNPAESAIKAGMSATASIITGQRKNVLLLPGYMLKKDSDGKNYVELMVNGKTSKQVVVTGLNNGKQTEIVSGLNEGVTVVAEKANSWSLTPRS